MNEVIYWIWLALNNGYGGTEAIRLLRDFPGGAREIWEASDEQLSACKDCGKAFLARLKNRDLTAAEEILEFCFTQGIRVISCVSPDYPRRLHDLYNKPLVLYARGSIENLNERFCVSMVGTRDMSEYGKHMTFRLARQLIGYGAIIVSGAAYGIDSSANNTAVFFEAPTIAVLGSGVNVPYPASNKEMLDKIAANGMVLSEYPPNTPPNGRNFPVRNRIISGLCDALVVVEAGERSGALITARQAAEQRRRVYAIPGNVGAPNSIGTNNLIRDGAKLAARSEDILEDFVDQFGLQQIDHIVNSDKYRRYEYNSKIPIAPENLPIRKNQPAPQKVRPVSGPPAAPAPAPNPAPVSTPVPPLAPAPVPVPKAVPTPPPVPAPKPVSVPAPVSKPAPEPPPAYEPPSLVNKNPERVISFITLKPRPPMQNGPIRLDPDEDEVEAEENAHETHEPVDRHRYDLQERILTRLDPVTLRVYKMIPSDQAFSTDQIVQKGFSADEVMAALTMLELYAAVEALPGGYYKKLI